MIHLTVLFTGFIWLKTWTETCSVNNDGTKVPENAEPTNSLLKLGGCDKNVNREAAWDRTFCHSCFSLCWSKGSTEHGTWACLSWTLLVNQNGEDKRLREERLMRCWWADVVRPFLQPAAPVKVAVTQRRNLGGLSPHLRVTAFSPYCPHWSRNKAGGCSGAGLGFVSPHLLCEQHSCLICEAGDD